MISWKIAGCCLLLLLTACAKEGDGPGTGAVARECEVVFLSGDAEVEARPGGEARAVRVGMRLGERSVLRTLGEAARLDLRLPSGATIRLTGKSLLVFSQLYNNGRLDIEKTGLELLSGSIFVKTRALLGDSRFQVRTETATVGVRGTEFLVRHSSAAGTSVAVQSGRVAVIPRVALPAVVGARGEASVEQVRAAATVVLEAGQQVQLPPPVMDSLSRRVAEAVAAAAEADQLRAAEEALRGGAPRPGAVPAGLFRDFTDLPDGAASPPAADKSGPSGTGAAPVRQAPPEPAKSPPKAPAARADNPMGE